MADKYVVEWRDRGEFCRFGFGNKRRAKSFARWLNGLWAVTNARVVEAR